MKLLEAMAALTRENRKTYRPHVFVVPAETRALRIDFRYDRGGEDPHSLAVVKKPASMARGQASRSPAIWLRRAS